MTTHLALNLTHDAIMLLHRTADGWFEVGTARLEAPDFARRLAGLRATAAKIGGMDYHTALIIPDSQILYTSVAATGLDRVADEARVRAALDGATPYPVSELVYDWDEHDERLSIAVVAQDTLREAEAFAEEHGFRPVRFTVIPPEGRFTDAPWFGATSRAAELVQNGDRRPDPQPPIAIAGSLSPQALDALIATRQAEQDSQKKAAAEATPDDAESQTPELDAPPTVAAREKPAAMPEPVDKSAAPQPENRALDAQETATEPSPTFTSRRAAASDQKSPAPGRRQRSARKKTGQKAPPKRDVTAPPEAADAARPPTPAPIIAAEPDPQPQTPSFASIRARREPGDASAPSLPPPPTLDEPTAERRATPARKSASSDGGSDLDGADGFLRSAAPTLSGMRGDSPKAATGAERSSTLARLSSLLKRDAPHAETQAKTTPSPRDEADSLTVFGARADQRKAAKPPGRAGLVFTATIIVVLLVIGLWAGISYRAEIEAWLRDAEDPAPATVAARAPQTDAPARETGPQIAAAPRQPPAPVPSSQPAAQTQMSVALGQQVPTPASPTPPSGSAADQRLARLAPEPPAALPPAAPQRQPEPSPLSQTQPEIEDLRDDLPLDLPEELLNDAEPELVLLSPAQTVARYAATGIWQSPPPQPRVSDESAINQLYLAAIDPVMLGADAVDLPRDPRRLRDDAPPRQANPTPPGADILLGADGLVIPSPGGTLNPDGILVHSGPPPSGPPPRRPGLPETAGTTADALADLRPRTRPGSLGETTQRARLGGRTLVELSSLRPLQRPASIEQDAAALRAEAETLAAREAEDIATKSRAEAEAAARGNASALAVTASLAPRARPAGLAPLQGDTATTEDTGPAVTASQRVQPSAPTPVSVARQATVENGIRLNRMNLIGIFGTPNDRSALVRLPSGRLLRLKVGDRLDGGRVGSIGDDALRYTKGGRDYTLEMPRG